MADFTGYEDAAAAFLQQFPLGTKVSGEEIIVFAEEHRNGLTADLLIGGDGKKLSSLRRHLNAGGASRRFAEDERFYILTSDAKRKIFTVRRLADHVQSKASAVFSKTAKGALAPIKLSRKEIDDLKLEELDDDQRQELEAKRVEYTKLEVPLKKLLNATAIERWTDRLVSKGYSPQQATQLIKDMGSMQLEMKLIAMTSPDA